MSITNYFMCRYQTTFSGYIPHMNTLQSIIWPEALLYMYSTLLEYATEQICLPHCTYMSHCISTVGSIYTIHYCTHPPKINKLQYLFIILLQNVCQQQICPSNANCTPNAQFTQCASMEYICQYIYASYELTSIDQVTRSAVHRWWCTTTTTIQDNYDATAWLHILSWLLGQISQNLQCDAEEKGPDYQCISYLSHNIFL